MANKFLKATGSLLISCLMITALSSNVKAEEPQQTNICKITTGNDFDNLYITVKGIGKPPANMPAGQAKAMAKKAAMAVAYSNLAKVIGVTIREQHDDVVTERVNAFIQGAKVVSEKELPDGSYEVEMTMPVLSLTRQTNTKIDDATVEIEKAKKNIENLNKQIKELNDKIEKQKTIIGIIKQTCEQIK